MRRLIAACLIAAAAGTPARAQDAVQFELADLAEEVTKVLRGQDQTAVAVGPFVGKARLPTNFGPEIQRVLIAELAKRKITTNKDALVMVSGSYLPATDRPEVPDSKELFVRINAVLENTKTGLPLPNVNITSRAVHGAEDVTRILGFSFRFPRGKLDEWNPNDWKARRDEILKRYANPYTAVDGAKVRAAADSPFAVEVVVPAGVGVRAAAIGRTPALTDGLAYVRLQRGEAYRLRIHNAAPFDAAVKVSIDGIDQFAFADPEFRTADGQPRFRHMVIPKGKTADIQGWFRNLKTSDAFEIADYAKSAAAELKANPAEAGVICLQFRAAWLSEADRPADEPRIYAGSIAPTSPPDIGTARGKQVETPTTASKHETGVFREQVVIRYTPPQP